MTIAKRNNYLAFSYEIQGIICSGFCLFNRNGRVSEQWLEKGGQGGMQTFAFAAQSFPEALQRVFVEMQADPGVRGS